MKTINIGVPGMLVVLYLIIIGFIITSVILAVLYFAGLFDSTRAYPKETRDTFMNACTRGNGQFTFCKCSFDKIQKQFTLDEYEQMDYEMRRPGAALPYPLTKIAESCIAKISSQY